MPESLNIRVAVPSDLEEISRYRRTDEPGGADPARMLRYLQGEHHPTRALLPRAMLVAFDGDKQAGYVAGHLTTRFDCDGEVQWIYVRSELRKNGIGTAMLRAMFTWFVGQGAREICVDPGNDEARLFYIANGAEPLNDHWLVWRDISVL